MCFLALLPLLLLLLCCCKIHGPPGSVLAVVTVQQQSRCELSHFCDSHGRCFCLYYVCFCARLYVPGICAWRVCSHKISIVRERHSSKQYNCRSRAASSRLRASRHGACVGGWCTAGDRATTVSLPMQQSNTHGRTSYQIHKAYSSSKHSSSFLVTIPDTFVSVRNGPYIYHWKGCVFPLFNLRRPRHIKLTPSRRGTSYGRTELASNSAAIWKIRMQHQ